jgi:hypothetical protein
MLEAITHSKQLDDLMIRRTDSEWIEIFAPESHTIVTDLYEELTQKRTNITARLDKEHTAIDAESDNEEYRYFWKAALNAKYKYDEQLRDLDTKLARLRRYIRIIKGAPLPKGAVTSDLIQAAKEAPIESLFSQKFKKSGNKLQGLCPFMTEKTPSFFIYKNTNRCWCFGCQQGGNTIDTYIKLHECTFNEAVLALTGSMA